LARNHTFSSLKSTLYTLLSDIKYNPIPISTPAFGFLLDYTTLQSFIGEALYAPASWPSTSIILDGVLTGNYTAIENYITSLISSSSPTTSGSGSIYGIMSGDKIPRAESLDGVLPTLNTAHRSSRVIGDLADRFSTVTAQWKFEAKERFAPGNEVVKTKNPMLVIGNTYDPVTPLASAQNVSAAFEGSVVLQHDGYGVGVSVKGL
jgi:hypothetical protein